LALAAAGVSMAVAELVVSVAALPVATRHRLVGHKSPTILARKGFAGSFDGVDISGHDPIGQGAEDGGRSVQQ
jgi:hypothetical protein